MAEQNLDFNIVAHTQGMEQIANLINRVGALEAETKKLTAANTGLAKSTESVVRNGVRYNNALDAQSRALRNTRMGTQQLGMQINDMATSISTGASPIQAFNQQIGQIGFAMSMMGGKLGAVGSFLAGPWSILIIGAAMVLGPLIEGLLNTGAAADAAKKKADDLNKAESAFRDSTLKLMESRLALQGPIEKNVEGYRKLYIASLNAAKADLASARTAVVAAQQRIRAAEIEASTIAKLKSGSREGKTGIAKSGLAGMIGSAVGFGLDLFGYGKDGQAAKEEKMVADTAANIAEAGVNAAQKILNDFEKNASTGFSKSTGNAAGNAAASAANRISGSTLKDDAAKNLEAFYEIIDRGNKKELPEYERQIMAIEEAFLKLNAAQQASDKNRFTKIFAQDKIFLKEGQDQISDYLKTPIEAPQMSVEMEDIISKADEMNKSFEAIGNSVSDAFKGMLTGAMSWKDGMRSLIGSVIDQLWKLFVVQKIVGFVSSALGGMTGTPSSGGSFGSSTGNYLPGIPANAYGGSVMGNKPTLVGERGPELFIPGGNGTIIPNSNMRGGGGGGSSFNISVDARGSSDPAAVRAQVQQGILEAAPAIIAA
ncbi:MAG: hypothetical protein ACOVKL_03400, partial [Polynucleobacter sp.]